MTKIMHERFSVTVIHTSDIITVDQLSYHHGYNQRLTEHIDLNYGDGSVEETMVDVQAYRKKVYDEHFKQKDTNPDS